MKRRPDLPIESERLRLRRFRGRDLRVFLAYRNDPEVARYQSWKRVSPGEGRRILGAMRGLAAGTPGRWLQIALEDKTTGVLIGDCAIRVDRVENRQAEIGFTLGREHQGRGFATEAVSRLMRFAFEDLRLHRLTARTVCENVRSIALLERLGMRREGHFIDNSWFKGAWASEYLYALLEREWRPGTGP
jgi:RimJ/RimL family protein N-acetyltransferase